MVFLSYLGFVLVGLDLILIDCVACPFLHVNCHGKAYLEGIHRVLRAIIFIPRDDNRHLPEGANHTRADIIINAGI